MFRSKTQKEPTELELAIIDIYNRMKDVDPGSKEYKQLLKSLEKLTGMQTKQRRSPLSLDTLFTGLCSITGILIIVAYEREHVMASKALGFLMKKKA